MNILMLNNIEGAVGSYRITTPMKALQRAGHTVTLADNLGARGPQFESWLVEQLPKVDVVYTCFSADVNYIKLLAAIRNYSLQVLQKNLPIITDCDDDILNVPSYNLAFKAYGASQEAKRAVLVHLKSSDAITVTKPCLTETYTDFNDHIAVLPNCVDPADWEGLPVDPARRDSQDIRIIFAGGLSRKNDVDILQEALERVMSQRPNVRLFFMAMLPDWVAERWCTSPSDPSANRAFFINAAEIDTYRQVMCWGGFDICIAPVVKNAFNTSKSNIKVLESPFYNAASICSDWGTYDDVPSEVTLKCDTTYEWTESLLALIDDPALRQKKVKACKEWALTCRDIDSNIHLWEECYQDALSRPVIDSDGAGIKESAVRLATPAEMEAIGGV